MPAKATGQAKRKARRKAPREELRWYHVAVTGASVRVSRRAKDLDRSGLDETASTSIEIEGIVREPVLRTRTASIHVYLEPAGSDYVGAAIGVTTVWQVAAGLPREQFRDVLAMVLVEKLARVELLLPKLNRGKGRLLSVSFSTLPLEPEFGESEPGQP